MTWDGAAPPDLAPPSLAQKLRGGLRAGAALALTLLALGPFLLGRRLRRRVAPATGFHFAVARLWARAMLRLMGVRLVRRGAPIAGPGVLAANHASWADILALRAATPRLDFVSKAEVRDWPQVGRIAEIADTVFIERRRSASRRQSDALRDRLRAGALLCIFPEGTSSDGRRVLPFRSALLSAAFAPEGGAPTQPVTLNWIAPPGQPPEFYAWWGRMDFRAHIWAVLCRSAGGVVEVTFHPPRAPADFADRKSLALELERAVREAKRA